MKKATRVRIILPGTNLYYKTGIIKNCIEENGEFYYYVKVQGEKGLSILHSSAIEVL